MRTLLECGYSYGWRHEELFELRVRQVDVLGGIIRLDPCTTKNDEGWEVAMTRTVLELLTESIRGKQPEDYVFTREDGSPVRDFRQVWANVCSAAGVGELLCPRCEHAVNPERQSAICGRDCVRNELTYRGLLFHDLRRTAVRSMVRSGIPERVAMTISGHKTRSVFDRYNIVAPSDLRDAARKLETSQRKERESLKTSGAPEFGQTSGRVAPQPRHAPKHSLPAPHPN
jgi:hypothetical protein